MPNKEEEVTVHVTFRVKPSTVHRRVGNVSTAPLNASLTEAINELFTPFINHYGEEEPDGAIEGWFSIE